jgi:hypothetical protein
MNKKLISLKRRYKKMDERERRLIKSLTSLLLFNILLIPIAWASIISLLWLLALLGIEIMRMEERRVTKYIWYYKGRFRQKSLDSNKLDCIKHRNEEFVGVAESPSITFSRVNEFEAGASYRR